MIQHKSIKVWNCGVRPETWCGSCYPSIRCLTSWFIHYWRPASQCLGVVRGGNSPIQKLLGRSGLHHMEVDGRSGEKTKACNLLKKNKTSGWRNCHLKIFVFYCVIFLILFKGGKLFCSDFQWFIKKYYTLFKNSLLIKLFINSFPSDRYTLYSFIHCIIMIIIVWLI